MTVYMRACAVPSLGVTAACVLGWPSLGVGLVLHSVLLVPYFSWQYSHAKHHAKTNHLLDGETHNPATRRGFQKKGFETMFHVIVRLRSIQYACNVESCPDCSVAWSVNMIPEPTRNKCTIRGF